MASKIIEVVLLLACFACSASAQTVDPTLVDLSKVGIMITVKDLSSCQADYQGWMLAILCDKQVFNKNFNPKNQ